MSVPVADIVGERSFVKRDSPDYVAMVIWVISFYFVDDLLSIFLYISAFTGLQGLHRRVWDGFDVQQE